METKAESIIHPLPSDPLLAKEEEFWRVTLPSDYKDFIRVSNGGIPERRSFTCHGHTYLLTRFLCILEDPTHHELGLFDIDAIKSQLDERLIDDEDLIGVACYPLLLYFPVISFVWIFGNVEILQVSVFGIMRILASLILSVTRLPIVFETSWQCWNP